MTTRRDFLKTAGAGSLMLSALSIVHLISGSVRVSSKFYIT